MNILLTECYSASNIGDLELVSRSLQIASEIYAGSTIECIASDPDSFAPIIAQVPFSRPIFDRLKMIKGNRITKALGAMHAGLTVGAFSVASLLPTSMARGLVRVFLGLGLGSSTAAKYLQADRIVAVGGGYLGDKYVKMTALTVWTWWWASRMGCKVETMPMSVEVNTPFLQSILRTFGKNIVWRVRDQASHSVMQQCQINCELVPDLAFLNAERLNQQLSSRSGLLVALVGGDYLNSDDQAKLYSNLAESIAEVFPTLKVTLLSMHRSMGGTHVGGDVEASQKMAQLLTSKGIENCLVNASIYSEVCDHCQQVEYVISARMHAGIAALCAGAKVGLLAYEEKHTALMSDLGIKAFAVDIRSDKTVLHTLVEGLKQSQAKIFEARTKQYYEKLMAWISNQK